MKELGELESQIGEFEKRGVRIVAVSVDDREQTEQTQRQFPHLVVLGDPERKMTAAFHAIHEKAGLDRSDIAAPTTLLLDSNGTVRWTFRPDRVIARQSPADLLAAVDNHLLKK